jgi:hypothetical protein
MSVIGGAAENWRVLSCLPARRLTSKHQRKNRERRELRRHVRAMDGHCAWPEPLAKAEIMGLFNGELLAASC